MWAEIVEVINSAELMEIKSSVLPCRRYPTYILHIFMKEPEKRMHRSLCIATGCHCASANLSHREQMGQKITRGSQITSD